MMTEKEIIDAIREYLPFLIKFINWVINRLKKIKSSKYKKKIKRARRKRRAIFQDNLTGRLTKWTTIEGNPQISDIRGKLPNGDSLLLEEIPGSRRHTFIGANNVNIKDGEIECDVYLEMNALVNIVIRADTSWKTYYMVRLDSRNGCFNGVLFDPGNRAWDFVKKASTNVKPDNWYHIKVKFQSATIKLSVDKKLVTSVNDKKIVGPGNIGIFNEVKRVFVNNFVVKKF